MVDSSSPHGSPASTAATASGPGLYVFCIALAVLAGAEPALELTPDLVTISAGGNDMLRPGADPDDIAVRLDAVIEKLAATGATVTMFDGPDIGNTPVLRSIRGRVAIFNENLRVVGGYTLNVAGADLAGLTPGAGGGFFVRADLFGGR